ncbi:MAG: hypothetical protein ACPGXX_15835 [Planctomycetaceae bacterium]
MTIKAARHGNRESSVSVRTRRMGPYLAATAAIGPAIAVSQPLTGEVASGILLTAASDSDLRKLFARREFEVLGRLQAGVIRSEGIFGSGY